jgi:hypothetical protein
MQAVCIWKREYGLNRATRWKEQRSTYTSKTRAGTVLSASVVFAWNRFARGGEQSGRVEDHLAGREYRCSVVVLVRGTSSAKEICGSKSPPQLLLLMSSLCFEASDPYCSVLDYRGAEAQIIAVWK